MKVWIAQWYHGLQFIHKQWLFAVLAVVSAVLMVVGIRAWIRMFTSKEITSWAFDKQQHTITIPAKGYYAVYIHGKLFRPVPLDWHPEIVDDHSGEQIKVNTSFFGVQTTSFDRGKVELFGFHVERPGNYTLTMRPGTVGFIGNVRQQIGKHIIPVEDATSRGTWYLSVRTGNSLWQKIGLVPQMALAFVGLLGIVFSMILAVNPDAFHK